MTKQEEYKDEGHQGATGCLLNNNGFITTDKGVSGGANLPGCIEIHDLSNKQLTGEGPYILGKKANGVTTLWCYNGGSPASFELGTTTAPSGKGNVVGRSMSNHLEIPLGDKLWRNGRLRTLAELSGTGSWTDIWARSISPENGIIAATARLTKTPDGTPIPRDQQDHAILLLPIEILDKDKKAVTKLKIGKMAESGVLSGAGSSATLNIDKDSDRFFIRVTDSSQRGKKPKVRWWTESDDQRYSDNSSLQGNIIELDDDPSNPACLISKSLLLVSDGWDDICKVDGVEDNALNDRTRRVAIGGKVRFEYLAYKATAIGTADATAIVPVQKTVSVKVYNCLSGIPGFKSPVFTQAQMDSQVDRIKERFAQCGIKVNVNTATGRDLGLLGNVDFMTYNPPNALTIPQSCAALFSDSAMPVGVNEIGVYLVNAFTASGGDKGETTVSKLVSAADKAKGFANKCIITTYANPQTTAHELLHVLLNAIHDSSPDYPTEYGDPTMLWHVPSIWNNNIMDTKRISPQQATDMPTKSSFPQ